MRGRIRIPVTPLVFALPALLLSGCHLIFGPEDGRMDWWSYCDERGCVQCNVDGCDLPNSSCDPDLPYDSCPAGSYCDPGRGVCRGKTCGSAADCSDGYLCDNGTCVPQRAPCNGHADCGAGAYCDNGTCRKSGKCSKDADCASLGDYECDPSGTCVPGKPKDKACTSGSSCAGGFCVGGKCGTCTGDCGGGKTCQLAKHCGAGRACLDGQCVATCKTSAACGSDQVCKGGYCVDSTTSQCTSDAQCGAGELCINKKCLPNCSSTAKCDNPQDTCSGVIMTGTEGVRVCTADHAASLECKTSAHCTGGETCVNGICRTACTTDKDCALCEDGPKCGAGGYCMTAAEASATCTKNSQCTGSQVCLNGHCKSL